MAIATFQAGLFGFKVVYILRACMSVFDDPASLRGQSFSYGLSPLDPIAEDSEEFAETGRLAVFIDEESKAHVEGPLQLYAPADPIDCAEEPTFSKDNLFIKGVSKVIPTVPAYGIILWDLRVGSSNVGVGNPSSVPSGWALCNGGVYGLPDGKEWAVPNLLAPIGGFGISLALAYIQKLPEGAKYLRKGFVFFNSGLGS